MSIIGPIIPVLERNGLPAKMLRYLDEHYRIEKTDREKGATDPVRNILYLQRGKFTKLMAFSWHIVGREAPDPFAVTEAVQELYHEGTHAYLDYHLDQARLLKGGPQTREAHKQMTGASVVLNDGARAPAKYVEEVMGVAAKHYDTALVKNPDNNEIMLVEGRGEDIAQEAAAMYVAHRVVAIWSTVNFLHEQLVKTRDYLRDGVLPSDDLRDDTNEESVVKKFRENRDNALKRYNEAMQEWLHGYLPQCGKYWGLKLGSRQCEVTEPKIPLILKTMCDRIMEGKAPELALAQPRIHKLTMETEEAFKKLASRQYDRDVPEAWRKAGQ